jgi:hypothetical protein
MPLTNAQKQAAHRARRSAKIERLEAGHRIIADKLEGRTQALAVELRTIALNALGSGNGGN